MGTIGWNLKKVAAAFSGAKDEPAAEDLTALEASLKRKVKSANSRLAEAEREIGHLEAIVQTLMEQQFGRVLLPPPELRLHVGRKPHAANFWKQGMTSSQRAVEVFGEAPAGPILDWGCGSGRTFQWLQRYPAWMEHYYGCDVDAEAIAYMRGKGVARVEVCQDLPPLPYDDDHFAGLFCFSVLTHIPPQHHKAWYQEIARVLRPGGLAYLTVQSDTASTATSSFSPEDHAAYRRQGYLWSEREGHYKNSALVSRTFTLAALEGVLTVEDYIPGGYHSMDAIRVRK